jgi:heat shock protein HtpX
MVFRQQRRSAMNRVKTFMLMAALTGVVVGTGWLIGGYSGMVIALAIAGVMNFASYWWSDRIVLRMFKAREVTEDEAPQLYAMVADLADKAAIPMPKVAIVPDNTPNAFATGRNPKHGVVAVTEGLLHLLEPQEVKAVLAHEIGHIVNRDTLIGTVSATFAGAVSMLAHMLMWVTLLGGRDSSNPLSAVGALVAMIFAPMAAMLIQMAISRSREFLADKTAAKLMGSGHELASALGKLQYGVAHMPPSREPEPATAHMFIVNPLSRKGLSGLFSTHPPMEMRIQRLMEFRPRESNEYRKAA